MRIFTFDTTLRDGTQGESVSFSVEDKLLIAEKLDELGIDYVEGVGACGVPDDDRRVHSALVAVEVAGDIELDDVPLHRGVTGDRGGALADVVAVVAAAKANGVA